MTKQLVQPPKPFHPANRSISWAQILIIVVFAIIGSVFIYRSFAANPNLPGDLDNNNIVELRDLSLLLSVWGQSPSANDLNGDGKISLPDLSILLSNWSKKYTPPPTPTPPTPPSTPPTPPSTPPTPNPSPVPTRQIKIMPLGSSTVEGNGSSNGSGFRYELYNKLVQEDKLNADFVGSMANGPASGYDRNHEGHAGWTIGSNSSLSASVVGWLNTYKPDVILFYAGLNDIRGGATGAETAVRFDAIAGKIFATSPNVKLIAGTTMKTTDNPSQQEQIRQFNIRMEPIAEKYRSQGRYLRIVDIDAVITPADHYDTIHANDSGYRKMVPVWLSGIRAAYPSL